MTTASKAQVLTTLRQKIRHLEGLQPTQAGLQFGVPAIDDLLPEGLQERAVHEFICDDASSAAATSGFLCTLLARLRSPNSVWVAREQNIYAPGLAAFSPQPQNILFVEARRDQEVLWTMEESLRCRGLGAVIGEVYKASLIATRRLQLAAEGGTTGFLIRHQPLAQELPSSCVSRWNIRPAPSARADRLPGLGPTRWQVDLLRLRGSRPASWLVDYVDGQFRFVTAEPQKNTAAIYRLSA